MNTCLESSLQLSIFSLWSWMQCQLVKSTWHFGMAFWDEQTPVMLLYCLNRDFNRSELIKVCRNTTISSPIIPMLATPWWILHHLWFYLILSKYSKRPANWVDFLCRLFVNYKISFFFKGFLDFLFFFLFFPHDFKEKL